eukprot:8149288-Pyramimonas_sp.AAC.1
MSIPLDPARTHIYISLSLSVASRVRSLAVSFASRVRSLPAWARPPLSLALERESGGRANVLRELVGQGDSRTTNMLTLTVKMTVIIMRMTTTTMMMIMPMMID